MRHHVVGQKGVHPHGFIQVNPFPRKIRHSLAIYRSKSIKNIWPNEKKVVILHPHFKNA